MVLTEKDKDRYWKKVRNNGDCWEWSGCLDDSGYGRFFLSGKIHKAHRMMLVLCGMVGHIKKRRLWKSLDG